MIVLGISGLAPKGRCEVIGVSSLTFLTIKCSSVLDDNKYRADKFENYETVRMQTSLIEEEPATSLMDS